ncbi:MAG TPA: carboxypeptidase M32, partial [Anaerolineales bacterium]|nr:carboxypeptidase M32 [Anaerolineales bacterium]
NWDQTTYMPVGGAPARGRQMATLARIAHEKFVSPEVGKLLDDLRPLEESLPYDSDDASLIRVTRRGYERQTRVPSERLAMFYQHSAESYQAWTEARPQNDFKAVQPLLEKTLDFSRELANYFPGYDHIADPLIDFSDYGMKAASVRQVFADLRAQLVPLVKAISSQPLADDSCLRRHFPKQQQKAFGEKIIRAYGYDFNRGRQDETHHPFMTKFSQGDVRITTRFNENDLGDGLFSTLHEAGHAMYELGVSRAYEGLPLGGGTSSGVHESQSRMWENIVGRSRPFWEHYYGDLQAAFPGTLDDVDLDTFYRAINKVQRSLIRTDADEVTYNLHVMIRFELELQLLEGALEIKDLPEAWHAAYQENLGLRAPDDRDGVLQDVHWYAGVIGGAFQGYTLGNIISGQFYAQALKAHPEIPAEVGQGKFETLHTWLRENIYDSGSKYTAPELIERVTGGGLTIEPYIHYLKTKYGELYTL